MVNQVPGKWNGRMTGFILFLNLPGYCYKKKKEKQDDMAKRFITIWFRHLKTDWWNRRQPELSRSPFVLAIHDRGRKVISAANILAEQQGIYKGIVVADAKAIFPDLKVIDDKPGLAEKLLKALAKYCIRYCPVVAIDPPDGLILDVTGCSHLWGGDLIYTNTIINRFKSFGYDVKAGI